MKQLCLSFLFVVSLATVSGAQTLGTLTENGVAMDVKAAVAVLDDGPALTFYLFPFQPTPEEIAKLQAGDTFWLLSKATPDAKKWKNGSPYGHFRLRSQASVLLLKVSDPLLITATSCPSLSDPVRVTGTVLPNLLALRLLPSAPML